MTGNQSDLARYLGVNKSTISRAIKAGRLVAEPDGMFDLEKNAARWHQTAGGRSDVAARHAAQRGAAIPQGQSAHENATAGHDASAMAGIDAMAGQGDSNRAKAKTILLHYENAAIKLEMALRRGLRLDLAAVRRESTGLGAMLRAGIERVIDQTAPRLAAAETDAERRRILDGEINRLRWIIKRELPRALRRMRQAGTGKGSE